VQLVQTGLLLLKRASKRGLGWTQTQLHQEEVYGQFPNTILYKSTIASHERSISLLSCYAIHIYSSWNEPISLEIALKPAKNDDE
jgi:hypothetical protein